MYVFPLGRPKINSRSGGGVVVVVSISKMLSLNLMNVWEIILSKVVVFSYGWAKITMTRAT